MGDMDIKNTYFDKLFSTPDLKWLGQNTNHVPTHPAVSRAMHDSIDSEEFHAYAPPAGFEALRRGILDDFEMPDASAIVTDGAVAGLYLVCQAFCRKGTNFVTTDPGWKWPLLFARHAGCEIREIPIYDPATKYKLTAAALEAAVDADTCIIYLVDPNNPLGVCYTRQEIEQFTAIARKVGAILIHDCTYRHFADDHTLAARTYPEGTVTTYSFSKWLGLAGLRIGGLISTSAIIEKLAAISPAPLGSSVLAQRAAIAGLSVKDEWLPLVRKLQRRNQTAIHDAVAKIPGMSIPVYPSQGNFLVIECIEAGIRPEALVMAYQECGIMIRQGTYHTPRFGNRFVKVSTSVPESWVDAFCKRLPDRIEAARGKNDTPALF
jgi:histidinol-phosphate aminotransferase